MKLSSKQLTTLIATYVAENKVAVDTFNVTKDNMIGLIDTIGKIATITHNYVDKLEMFDGEFLSFGKTISEWASDLILPEDYRYNGERALSRHELTYRPTSFSYTLGRKVIPLTIGYNEIERAVHNEGQFNAIIDDKVKKLADSKTLMRYAIKRQLLGLLATMVGYISDFANVDYYIDSDNKAWSENPGADGAVGELVACAEEVDSEVLKKGKNYLIVKPISSGSELNISQLLNQGYIIELNLETTIAKPVDTATGEAFIVALKNLVEVASDFSEGYSLNGATLGATASEGLVLCIKQGIMSELQVKTFAGAFQKDEVAIPVDIKVVKDFGDADDNVFAVLVDKRGIKLHPTYDATRENLNGDGDFLNMFNHVEYTAFVSRNVFIQVFKTE